MTNYPLPAQEVAAQQICRALGMYMGQGRRWTVEEVSGATGIKSRTLWSYIQADPGERSTVPGDKLLILCGFFGAEFTSKVLGVIGQGAHDMEPDSKAPGMVIANLVGGAAVFAELGADNVFDHRDQAKLEPIADTLIATLTPFSTKGR